MFLIRVFLTLFFCFIFIRCSKENDATPVSPSSSTSIGVINDSVNGTPIVVYADESRNLFVSYSRVVNGVERTFSISDGQFPVKLIDNEGEEWDIFGGGQSGTNMTEKLGGINYLIGYWFFYPSFYANIVLQSGEQIAGNVNSNDNEEWLIATSDIQYGSFRDGIQSIENPSFLEMKGKKLVENEFYSNFEADELVTVIEIDGKFKVYPHRILEFHEIVNDIEDEYCYTISFCPLTGTSRVWESSVNGSKRSFGVSGLLYNNNLIMYDRVAESHWSQILDLAVNGPDMGISAKRVNATELQYKDLNALEGEVLLLDPSSSAFGSYANSQYAEYRENQFLYFPLATTSNAIPAKERVLGVTVGNQTKVYRFGDF